MVSVRAATLQSALDSVNKAVMASLHSARICTHAGKAFADQAAVLRESQWMLGEALMASSRP